LYSANRKSSDALVAAVINICFFSLCTGGAEHAGVENAGADRKGGKCRSGKGRSDNAWKSVRRENYRIPVV